MDNNIIVTFMTSTDPIRAEIITLAEWSVVAVPRVGDWVRIDDRDWRVRDVTWLMPVESGQQVYISLRQE